MSTPSGCTDHARAGVCGRDRLDGTGLDIINWQARKAYGVNGWLYRGLRQDVVDAIRVLRAGVYLYHVVAPGGGWQALPGVGPPFG